GISVSLANNSTALVGADGNNSSQGAAYVFTLSGTTWSQQQELTASDGTANDFFGTSIAMSADGGTALIGAKGNNAGQGAAYVFTLSGATWLQQQELTASGGAAGDQFGVSLALNADGSTALTGADLNNSGQGAAYAYGIAGLPTVTTTAISNITS